MSESAVRRRDGRGVLRRHPGRPGRGADRPPLGETGDVAESPPQDNAVLQSAGIKPDDPLLADVKPYAEYPTDAAWVRKTVEAFLKRGDRHVPDSRGY